MARRVTLVVLLAMILASCGGELSTGGAASPAPATTAPSTATTVPAPTGTSAPAPTATSAPTASPPPEPTPTAAPRALGWEEVAVAGARPAPRRDAALAYDPARGRVLMFGGRNMAGAALDDTWAFDLASATWAEVRGDMRPPARFSTIAGVDTQRDRLLITTGDSGKGGFFNDVWSLDLASDTWTELQVAGEPPRTRYGSAGGIFPGGDALWLTHGFSDQGRFDDTWAFDLATGAWQNRTPAGELPLKRCLHAAALMGPAHLVLFGGCSSGFGPCPQGDTWLLDGAGWSQIASAEQPSARQHPGLVALGDARSALLFGGIAEGRQNQNDLWRLDPQAGSWARLEPAGDAPAPRNGHAMVVVDGAVLVFGGEGAAGPLDDLWRLTI